MEEAVGSDSERGERRGGDQGAQRGSGREEEQARQAKEQHRVSEIRL
jgi:hypothetical protein